MSRSASVTATTSKPGRRGRKRAPLSTVERELQETTTAFNGRARYISPKLRNWLSIYESQGFKDEEKAASLAGYSSPSVGRKLLVRYADLIEKARLRTMASEMMTMQEAITRVADMARDPETDEKVRLQALRTILQVEGALSDRPLPATNRATLTQQLDELYGRLQKKLKGGGKAKVRAVEVEIEGESDPEPPVDALSIVYKGTPL